METTQDTRSDLVGAPRRLLFADEPDRTPLLRKVAELIAEERSHHLREDGTPDWTGRTHTYREAIRKIYDDAGYSRSEASSLQSTLRYHVGSAVRRRVEPEAAEDLGLLPESPRERSRAYQRSLRQIQDEIGSSLLTLGAVHLVLQRIDPAALADLPQRERDVATVTLADIQRRSRELRDAVEGWEE